MKEIYVALVVALSGDEFEEFKYPSVYVDEKFDAQTEQEIYGVFQTHKECKDYLFNEFDSPSGGARASLQYFGHHLVYKFTDKSGSRYFISCEKVPLPWTEKND